MLEVASPKKTILVVDDDKSILRTFTRILQKSGYEIDTAETGKEAMEKTENRHYDLALVDIRLPRHGWHRFARQTQKTTATHR